MRNLLFTFGAFFLSFSSFAIIGPITGTTTFCAGGNTTLADTTLGGTWSSSNTGIAAVGAVSGVVTGVSGGPVTITYTTGTGFVTIPVTVNAAPISFFVTGGGSFCAGGTGVQVGINGSQSGVNYQLYQNGVAGTAILAGTGSTLNYGYLVSPGLYTVVGTITATGCTQTMNNSVSISVNPLPGGGTVTGGGTFCGGGSIGITSTSIGTNYQLMAGSSAIGSPIPGTGGPVNFGNQTVSGTYTVVATNSTTGCTATLSGGAALVVNPAPGVIAGLSGVCVGSTIPLTDAGTGAWTSTNTAAATVGSTGVVTGVALGTSVISFTLSSGCAATKTVTVSASPAPITGSLSICPGGTTTLTDAAPGGSWTSSSPGVATTGSSTGIVFGLSVGTATITYSLGSGCTVTAVVLVNSAPAPISGPSAVCNGASVTLSAAPTGGTWSSSTPAVATIGATSGLVTGVGAGVTNVTYTLSTGCSMTKSVTVSPAPPPIVGPGSVCLSSGTTLSDALGGGVWVSGNSGIASAGSLSGVITGVSLGTTTISYSLGTGCTVSKTVTVTPGVCSGTPAGGMAYASGSIFCTGGAVSINLTGAGSGCGIGYQWQSSLDYTVFTDVPGATNATYSFNAAATMWYRCRVLCITSGLFSYSAPATVTVSNTIANHTAGFTPDTLCSGTDFYIAACGVSSSFNATTWFGDGTSVNTPLTATGTCHADIVHNYETPGNYSVKQVLYLGTTPQDSVTFAYEHLYCNTLPIKLFFDANANCVFDGGESLMQSPSQIVVDSNGVRTDTISTTSGLYYKAKGAPGTVYAFRVINLPTGLSVVCPAGGVIYDTISTTVNGYRAKYFGVNCSGAGFDISESAVIHAGRHMCTGTIYTDNSSCAPYNAVVKLTFSPKYNFNYGIPVPTSVAGNVATWVLTPGTNNHFPSIYYDLRVPNEMALPYGSTWITPGDTVHTYIVATASITGEIDTLNNVIIKNDTVRSSYDPNDMAVLPAGTILPCTQLRYTIEFENTGNDTAHNVSVMDTLSDNLDPKTLTIESASGVMNIAMLKDGVHNIAKFDFPNINLLDSTHPNQCTGSIVFHISARQGLADGATIQNKAGIYFDDNPPVMTNATVNVIGMSQITGVDTVCPGVQIALGNEMSGGIWSISNARAGVSAGMITGITPGADTVSYTMANSCVTRTATKIVTVNSLPVAGTINGTNSVCESSSAGLAETITGGAWSTSSMAVTLNTTSGIVTGVASGTATITYSNANTCGTATTTKTITVNPLPAAISGSTALCTGATSVLTDVSAGGTWSSSSPGVATIGTGNINGVLPGTTTINYTLPTGCSVSQAIAVNALPTVYSITGGGHYCAGGTGVHVALGGSATGTNYSLYHGGILVGTTPGTGTALDFGTQTLPGGYTAVATNSSTSCQSGMTDSATITIDPLPIAGTVSGGTNICQGSAMTLTGSTTGGTWSSSNTSRASVNTSGLVSGVSAGAVVISYTQVNGCGAASATKAINIDPLPANISGAAAVCVGSTTVMTDASAGGVWSSNNMGVATIGTASGSVNGMTADTVTIIYTLPTRCQRSQSFAVNALPATYTVTGGGSYCAGSVGTHIGLSGSAAAISYTLYNGVTPAGMLTGTGGALDFGALTAAGTYTVVGQSSVTSCTANMTGGAAIVINPLPVAGTVTGAGHVCEIATISLSGSVPGGTWSSGGTANATINTSGVVTGVLAGTTALSYTITNGCGSASAIKTVTVDPLPAPISGGAVCVGATTSVTDASAGGTWSSGSPAIAAIGSTSGLVSGLAAGGSTIIYTLPTSCYRTFSMTVNPLPNAYLVTGGGSYCAGGTGTHVGLGGSVAGTDYLLYHAGTALDSLHGTGSALDFGLQTLTGYYTVAAKNTATTCENNMTGSTMIVTIPNVLPSVTIAAAPSGTVCAETIIHFSPLAVNGGTHPAYVWNVNGADVDYSNTYHYAPANGDVVKVKLFSDAHCAAPDTAETIITMSVAHPLAPVVSVSVTPSGILLPGSTAVFSATVSGMGTAPAYQWLNRQTYIAGATNATYTTGSLNNNDTISCIIVTANECGDAVVAGSATVTINTTGLSAQMFNRPFNVFPSPTSGEFTVAYTLPGNDNALFQVTDIAGRLLFEQVLSIKGHSEVFNIKSFEPGVYLYRVVLNGVPVYVGKVVKE